MAVAACGEVKLSSDIAMADDHRFRLAVCNELFAKSDFSSSCRAIKEAGWQGIEIAPFTLANEATTLSAERRREIRDIITSEGLEFVGLHWLTVGPAGLHVTTPDDRIRKRSWDFVRRLTELCADLRPGGSGGIMVFGSPFQRRTNGEFSPEIGVQNFMEGVQSIIPTLEDRGVMFLVEALPMAQSDVICTIDEAAEVVAELDNSLVKTMFDSHNAIDEGEMHESLVSRHWDLIRHIHINELDGSYPRPEGGYDFKPVLNVAKKRRFAGWLSMEVFDFTPGAKKIITEAHAYITEQIAQLD